MQSTATAVGIARGLADNLSKRLTGAGLNTVRQSKDSAGWPILFFSHNGSEAEGQPVLAIRIKNIDGISKDVFGNSSFAYTPHTLEIATELDSDGFSLVTAKDNLICQYEAIKTGVAIQLKAIANGTAVTAASMDAAAPVVSLDNLYWPTKGV